MWSARSNRRGAGAGVTDVYLSDREVALVDGAGEAWRHEAATLAAGLAALVERVAANRPPRRVRVWLGASVCRPVRIAAVAGARSRMERVRLANAVAVSESGLAPPCRVQIDAAGRDGAAIAVVVEEGVLVAIERAFAPFKSSVRSIRPWWNEALSDALASTAGLRLLGVFEGHALTILTGDGRGIDTVQTLYPVHDAEAASAAIARKLVSAMIPPDDALAVSLDWTVEPGAASGLSPDGPGVFTPWVRRLGAMS